MATRDYYATLGVAANADHEAIRAAYIERARRLHPDAGSSGTIEAARNERDLQLLNEAWNVLKDPDRRAAYDHERAPPDEPAPFDEHSDVEPESQDMEVTPAVAMLLRFGPALALGFVLFVLLVFTAVARSGNSDDDTEATERCALVTGDRAARVPCGEANATIVAEATRADACPESAEAFAGDIPGVLWCVEVAR